MSVFQRTVWICSALLLVLTTSMLGVISTGKLVSANHSKGTESMLKMQAPALDCQHYDESRILAQNQQIVKAVIDAAKHDTKAAHTCCPAFSNILTFPATMHAEHSIVRVHSLALIDDEPVAKPRLVSSSIYRPPIS
ncbi:hypothetical protein L3Q72_17030 [Vibrio sp. JC009]|uniref:hypothetical protein n=1 Tax=Vibrio sp. JC009 TaxID=2912314 RepID=UPI0023AE87B2|nr:hypothetical protein [Vibrio sp. JC009]WED24578.1 hypothetical protein L3Q72_17030 [Vibrio sp. JC009]